MRKFGIIYIITDQVTGKKYVGQTTGSVEKRWAGHCCTSQNQTLVARAIHKRGREHFKIEAVASAFDRAGLDDLEIFFIKQEDTVFPKGYNMTGGGKGNDGAVVKSMLGKHHSDKSKLRTQQTNIERGHSEPVRCLTNGLLYLSIQDAARRLGINAGGIWGCCNGKYEQTHGLVFYYEDVSKRVSFVSRGTPATPEARKVECLISSQIFNSVNDAARHFNVRRHTISELCSGKRKKSNKGLLVRYVINGR